MMFRSWFCKGVVVQYVASITGALAVMSYGMNSTWMSPYLPYLISKSSIIPMTSDEAAWCAIAPLIGCIFGALIAANLTDRIGRKYTVLMMAPVVLFCQIGVGYVRNVWYLSLLRMIIGVTDGACLTALPMYVGEIASPDIRGFLSSLICLFFLSGALLMNTLGSFLSISTSSKISACVPAAHFMGFVFMPESPYYYIKVKRYQQAEQSLRSFRGDSNIHKEMEVLKEAVRTQTQQRSQFTDLFTVPSNRKATCIYIILCLALRSTAKAPLSSYTRLIFEESGSNISPIASTIACCAVEFVVVMFTTYFIIDRFGKRFLAMISLAGCAITLCIMGVYFYLKDNQYDIIQHLNWLPISTLISYTVLHSIGISYAHMCYLSELYPTNVKANALCFAEIFMVATGATTTKVYQLMNDGFGNMYVSFFCFTAFCAVNLIFIVMCVPETKGKTLEEIQLFLMGKQTDAKERKLSST